MKKKKKLTYDSRSISKLKVFCIFILCMLLYSIIEKSPLGIFLFGLGTLYIIYFKFEKHIYLFFKWLWIYIKQKKTIQNESYFNEENDTDAINEIKFLSIEHKNRKIFFAGNYLKLADRYGRLRKLNKIIPAFIKYTDREEQKSKRRIDVYAITTAGGYAYLTAFCHSRGDARTFRIDKLDFLITKNDIIYNKNNMIDGIIHEFVEYIDNNYNKKVVINCLT